MSDLTNGDIVANQARSREGRGLSVRSGDGDKWITIQKNTFINWVNIQLQGSGYVVDDFEIDFDNGVKLCALIEALQHRKIGKVIKKPMNHHQCLENISLALKAVADDNVRLVNIGSEDIVCGSLKLILGLVWTLILRYQIGKTKVPPKSLMLAWLRAVIPECQINNFTSDWNDGVALCALIDYCQPGLFPNWRNLSRHNKLENCSNAMNTAREQLNIPMLVLPEDFSSPHLDELSGMTYLSYYMMQDSPGYFATRREIRNILQTGSVDNFTTDWNDGRVLCNLVTSVGGDIPGWPNLPDDAVGNLQKGLDGGQRLGVDPIFSASEIADPDVEHLGVMAYAARYSHFTPVKTRWNPATLDANLDNVYVGQEGLKARVTEDTVVVNEHRSLRTGPVPVLVAPQGNSLSSEPQNSAYGENHTASKGAFTRVRLPEEEKSFQVRLEEGSADSIRAELTGPNSSPPVDVSWSGSTATCSFTPVETGQHKLDVTSEYNSISGSPVNFRVLADRSQVFFNRPDRACVGMGTNMTVNAASAGDGDVRVEARSPSGYTTDVTTLYRAGSFDANFTPSEVGVWNISVLYDGEHIEGSPFPMSVYDPSRVHVSGLDGGSVGQSLSFTADAGEAGAGELGVRVIHEGSEVPSSIRGDGQGCYDVYFEPVGAGLHTVYVTMNDVEVQGSPYTVDIVDSSLVTLSGDGIGIVAVNQPTNFTVYTRGAGNNKLDVDIAGPDGNSVPFDRTTNEAGDVEITYTPTQVGDYMISAQCLGREVNGSPFLAKAYDVEAITVTRLEDGFVGQPIDFVINVQSAGEGQLQIMVNDGQIPNEVDQQDVGVYGISFVPLTPGPQTVEILFNDTPLSVSPLTCNAFTLDGEVDQMDQLAAVNMESVFRVKNASGAHITPDVTVLSPTGEQLESNLVRSEDGDYRVEWTPKQAGRHSVDVLFSGQRVTGSPFYIDVFDVSRIRVDNFFNGRIGQQAGFSVDTSEAGVCEQSVRVVSPSGNDLPVSVSETSAGCHSITYLPSESGPHNIYLSYNNVQMPGCPFSQEIGAAELPPVHGDGLYRGEEDRQAIFYIDAQGIPGEPSVSVDGPNSIAKCTLEPQADGRYVVTYVPVEVGMYDVQIKWNGTELPGSPYHPKVVCAAKVHVEHGWQHYMDSSERILLEVDKEKELPFDVSEAGPGLMSAEVKGPSGAIPVTIDDSMIGRNTVIFTPQEKGDHYIHVFWSEVPLPDTPFHGYAIDEAHEPSTVVLTGRGLMEATIFQEANFMIDASRAGPGEPEVRLRGISTDVNVQVTRTDTAKYSCTYIPTVPGAYLLHIKWNDRPLHRSPFQVNVVKGVSPDLVMVSADFHQGCVLDQSLSVRIDTHQAGPGELTAFCNGPTMTAFCELRDNGNGAFLLLVTPQEAGSHSLQVKYGGEHVKGSPFPFNVADRKFHALQAPAPTNAGRVRVTGMGVEHGILATYQSRFKVETQGAGSGQLTVRVRGPKNAFQVEMYRESAKDRSIVCRYDPTEKGEYIITVQWSGVEVPGSPFHVYIMDTEQELQHVLEEQSFRSAAFNTTHVGSGYGYWK